MNSPSTPPAPNLRWLFFSPRGRIGRWTFLRAWFFWLCLTTASAVAVESGQTNDPIVILGSFGLVIVLPLWLFSTIMLGFKRAHDMGVPGPVTFMMVIPYFGFAAFCAFVLWPPKMEDNPFGNVMDGPPG